MAVNTFSTSLNPGIGVLLAPVLCCGAEGYADPSERKVFKLVKKSNFKMAAKDIAKRYPEVSAKIKDSPFANFLVPTLFIFKISYFLPHTTLFNHKNSYVPTIQFSCVHQESKRFRVHTGTAFGKVPIVVTECLSKTVYDFHDSASITVVTALPPPPELLQKVISSTLKSGLIHREVTTKLHDPITARYTTETSFYFARELVPGTSVDYFLCPNHFHRGSVSDFRNTEKNVAKTFKSSMGHYMMNMRKKCKTVIKAIYETEKENKVFPHKRLFTSLCSTKGCQCCRCTYFSKIR